MASRAEMEELLCETVGEHYDPPSCPECGSENGEWNEEEKDEFGFVMSGGFFSCYNPECPTNEGVES